MASSDSRLKKISADLKHLSLKRQQLLERKKMRCIFQELRNRAGLEQTEDEDVSDPEVKSIDEKLKDLSEQKAELQEAYDNILKEKDINSKKEMNLTPPESTRPPVPPPTGNIFFVEAPPTIQAPTVILDLEKLPRSPCRTQCPECYQFIMTETYTSVNSVTWMLCFMTAMMGCVAGCCLIPFCVDKFKTITHRCPKCRTSIQTVKKL